MPGSAPNQSIQRTTTILFALAGVEDGRTVRQIADAIGVKPNTCTKLIWTLEREGLVSRRHQPLRFLLGPSIHELAHLDDHRQLLTTAEELMSRAHARFPSANIALLEFSAGTNYQRLHCSANQIGRVVRRRHFVSRTYELASTGVFLAYCDPSEAATFFRNHPFEIEGKRAWGTRRKFEAFLAEVRREGVAMPNTTDRGFFRLAAPVFGPRGDVMAAIGGYIPDNASQTKKRQLIKTTRKLAADIASQIQVRRSTNHKRS